MHRSITKAKDVVRAVEKHCWLWPTGYMRLTRIMKNPKIIGTYLLATVVSSTVLALIGMCFWLFAVLKDPKVIHPVVLLPAIGFVIFCTLFSTTIPLPLLWVLFDYLKTKWHITQWWSAAIMFVAAIALLEFGLQMLHVPLDWRQYVDQRNILMERETIETIFFPISRFHPLIFWPILSTCGFTLFWITFKYHEQRSS